MVEFLQMQISAYLSSVRPKEEICMKSSAVRIQPELIYRVKPTSQWNFTSLLVEWKTSEIEFARDRRRYGKLHLHMDIVFELPILTSDKRCATVPHAVCFNFSGCSTSGTDLCIANKYIDFDRLEGDGGAEGSQKIFLLWLQIKYRNLMAKYVFCGGMGSTASYSFVHARAPARTIA